jgi:hypothetical protein
MLQTSNIKRVTVETVTLLFGCPFTSYLQASENLVGPLLAESLRPSFAHVQPAQHLASKLLGKAQPMLQVFLVGMRPIGRLSEKLAFYFPSLSSILLVRGLLYV